MNQILLNEKNVVIAQDLTGVERADFIEAPDEISPGAIHDGSDSYKLENFSAPLPKPKTAEDVTAHKRDLIVGDENINDMIQIHEREVAHNATDEANYTITPEKYQEWLDYFQLIRAFDSGAAGTPEDAIEALNNLTRPE